MVTRSTHRPPQTIKQAKAEYKKYGPRISSQEQRQIERGAELFRRAEKIKDAEKRRRMSLKRKQDKELKEREQRRNLGITTPKPTIRGSQAVLDGFMSGVKKPTQGQAVAGAEEIKPTSNRNQEPWEDDIDDGALMDGLVIPRDQAKTLSNDTHANISNISDMNEISPALTTPTTSDLDGAWDDLLISNTQVERELKTEDSLKMGTSEMILDPIMSLISTQDVILSMDELEELGLQKSASVTASMGLSSESSKERDKALMPPPPLPCKTVPTYNYTLSASQFSAHDFELSIEDIEDIWG